ncbi:MAG: TolC family protein [Deltaproteobacteria bacterium]|nr:TolC family protein [Deltaproteobacteria bacterium]
MIAVFTLCVAAAADTLTLDVLHRSVREHFPMIVAAQRELAMAEAERLAADGGFDPRFVSRLTGDVTGNYRGLVFDTAIEQPTPLWGASVFTGYRLGVGAFPDYEGKDVTGSAGEIRAGVNVPLLRNGPIDRTRAAVKRSEIARERALAGVAATELEALRVASNRYYAWIGAASKLRLAEQMLALATERQSGLASRVAAGDLPLVERIDNERAIAQRRAQLASAERALEQAAIDLSLYLRDAQGAPMTPNRTNALNELVEPTLDLSALEALKQRARNARPDLLRLRAVVRDSRVDLGLQKNQLWPALDVRATAAQDLGLVDPGRRQFELQVGVVLDLPLAFRFQRGRVLAAEASVARNEMLLQMQEERAVNEVQDAASAARMAHQRIAATREEVSLADELARLERSRFQLGESTVLFVNIREQASIEARVRQVDALVDAHRALVDLEAASGAFPTSSPNAASIP